MGIGLVFWGTAEPLSHYAISSPTGNEATTQGMRDALRYTFFHWGIHAWAIYGLVALLALVKLEGYEKRFPSQLSGGQRQRDNQITQIDATEKVRFSPNKIGRAHV